MNERDYLCINLPETSAVVIARKESEKTTSVPILCLSIPLLPAPLRSDWDRCSVVSYLHVLLIMIVVGVNDSIAEHGGSKINIAGAFKQFLTFLRNAGDESLRGCNDLFILSCTLWIGTLQASIAEHRSMPRLREPIGCQIHIEGMFGNSGVDEISRGCIGSHTKVREHDSRMFIHNLLQCI